MRMTLRGWQDDRLEIPAEDSGRKPPSFPLTPASGAPDTPPRPAVGMTALVELVRAVWLGAAEVAS
jgi:hypothetical protein